MAKSKSKNEIKTQLSLVTISGSLDVGDVLSVVTSRAELRLHGELDEAKNRLEEARTEFNKLEKEATNKYKQECKAAAEAIAVKLRSAVESVGGKVTIVEKTSYNCDRRDRNEDGLLEQWVRVLSGKHQYAEFAGTAPPSPELLALESALISAKNLVDQRQDEAMRARRKLANVPMLERKARARLAEAKLSENEEGRAVLEAITQEFEADFLALPGN